MTKEELIEQEKQVRRRCAGPFKDPSIREKVNALLAEGKTEEAKDLNTAGRTFCGYDLNEIFFGELDGKIHEYKCPSCGQAGRYRAAKMPEAAE